MININRANTDFEFKICFNFFTEMWKNEFEIDLNTNIIKQFNDFKNSNIYYIKNISEIISVIQFTKIYKWFKLWNGTTIDKDAYILWRIWVKKEYRKQWLWKKIINYWLNEIKQSWINLIYIPSEINNIKYYSQFWFKEFWNEYSLWNTKVIFMKNEI